MTSKDIAAMQYLSSTVSMGVVKPVGPNPMKPEPLPEPLMVVTMWPLYPVPPGKPLMPPRVVGRWWFEGEPLSLGKLKAA